jgi:uncharacterized protein
MPAEYYRLRSWLEGTYTLRILDGFFDLFLKIGPYLAVSIIISVVATRLLRGKTLLFSMPNEFLAIVLASVVGLVSPLPTYAAIPVGLSLMPAGVPFSAVFAFAVSSPLMNPSIFFLTATRLGMEMAVARSVAALVAGIAGGALVMALFRSVQVVPSVPLKPPQSGERTLGMDVWKTSLYTARFFSIAILLSAAVKALVPAQMVVDLVGEHAAMGTLVAIGLGVPFYSCGGAAIPIVETMMDLGMSKGATLAFFIAGPATKLETLYAFRTTMGGKLLLLYLALTFTFAFLAGLLYSLV